MSELSRYDYTLPRELIAQQPLPHRADARLLLVERAAGSLRHEHVRDLPEILRAGDCLVLNDTRVVPARLIGHRSLTGGRWEGLFISADESGQWQLLSKARGRISPGERLTLVNRVGGDDVQLRLIEKRPGGLWIAVAESKEGTFDLLDRVGRVPLPHYIRGGEMVEDDRQRYQTVYARHPGSVAAPTAGLHFTEELLSRLVEVGVAPVRLTLHVGLDTFRPIGVESLAEHKMHSERGHLDEAAAERLRQCKAQGGRVVAVGTTTVRVLETAAATGQLHAWSGSTDLFIRPGFEFRAVDALLTNFHLPRTSLLVLVRAFGGDELVMRAYEEAIRERYRFYSYGDAMLIV
jgi:S-adenosylmethionine:tRNA ribosyltransferase-isomerase